MKEASTSRNLKIAFSQKSELQNMHKKDTMQSQKYLYLAKQITDVSWNAAIVT